MITALVCVLSALSAQTPAAFYGSIPKEVQTFCVSGPNAQEVCFALRSGDEWLSDLDQLPSFVEMHVDTPWQPAAPQNVARNRVEQASIETRTTRERRLREGWAVDYTFVGDRPVRTEDLTYARRAQEMKQKMLAERYPEVAQETPGPSAVSTSEREAPGFGQQWGGHLFLVVLCVALGALVTKGLILD